MAILLTLYDSFEYSITIAKCNTTIASINITVESFNKIKNISFKMQNPLQWKLRWMNFTVYFYYIGVIIIMTTS